MFQPPKKLAGFSLIEVLIAIAIVGILGSIAMPSYREYVQRTQRANARNTLIQTAQWMERAATATGTYPLSTAPSQIPAGLLIVEGGQYTVAVTSTNGTTYTITATRKAGSGQAADKCGDFVLNQANSRTVINFAASLGTAAAAAASCWNR